MAYKNTLDTYNSQISMSLSVLLPMLLLFLSLFFFAISLFLPTFFTSEGDLIGGWVFITGWIGIVVFQFAWYANPLNVLALLISTAQPRLSLLLSILALIIASETFLLYEIPTGLSTGSHQEKIFIKELGVGSYCWYFSQILFLLALMSRYLVNRDNK